MAELFKFRCPRCAKLLGVAPRKIGKPIDCPQCGTELVVPSPEDEAPAGSDAGDEAASLGGLGIDLGFSSPLDTRPAGRPTPREPEPAPDEVEAIAFLEQVASAPPAGPPPPPELDDDDEDDPDRFPDLPAQSYRFPAIPQDPGPEPSGGDDDEDEPEPIVQAPVEPLVARGPRGRRPGPGVDRRRDVVLPRTAVVAWALFAILALAGSFVAGLMIGHYRWK